MGADVIKVESPEGDVTRGASPARHRGMGAVYLNINRSKRGIVLDLKQAAGREALLRLVTDADVFVHSMRPETMARLGLTSEDRSEEHTSELQSLMRISYAVFCLKKK